MFIVVIFRNSIVVLRPLNCYVICDLNECLKIEVKYYAFCISKLKENKFSYAPLVILKNQIYSVCMNFSLTQANRFLTFFILFCFVFTWSAFCFKLLALVNITWFQIIFLRHHTFTFIIFCFVIFS